MSTVAAQEISEGRLTRPFNALIGVLAMGGLVAAVTALDLGAGSSREVDASSLLRGLVVASYVFVGAYTLYKRQGSRFGLYLIGLGLLYSIATLAASNDEVTHGIGRVAFAVLVVCLSAVLLSFPQDRLGTRIERWVIGVFAAASAFLWALALPLLDELPAAGPLTDCGESCPANPFRVVDTPAGLASALGLVVTGVTAAGLIAVGLVLVSKARSPGSLRRRLVVPLLVCAAALALNYAVFSVLREAGIHNTAGLKALGAVTALAIPFAILLGQLRGQLFAVDHLGELIARVSGDPVTPTRMEMLLREALGDPLLTLAVYDRPSGGYVDVRGKPLELPENRTDVGVTSVVREGQPVAALIHDPAFLESDGLTKVLAATSFMLLENAHLVEELQASRTRIVTSAQRERLRLERNLHDGAQQRMFSMQIKLQAARDQTDDAALAEELDELAIDAAAAVQDLRSLAQGLYPTVLRERGLPDGLRSFARASAVPVKIVDCGLPRLDATVEEAVYFCVLEAIQNATKHAGSRTKITVTLELQGGKVEFAVVDDGAGFDTKHHNGGIGIVSMRDRVGAVGGTLEIASRPSAGTIVRGVVPVHAPFVRSG